MIDQQLIGIWCCRKIDDIPIMFIVRQSRLSVHKSIRLLLQPDAKAVEINKCPNIAPWSQVFDKNIKRHITLRHFPVTHGTDEYHVAEMESTHPAGQIPLLPHA